MKKYFSKISIGLIALFVFSSCEEDIVNYNDAYNAYAGFNSSSSSMPVFEDTGGTVLVRVDVSTPADVDRAIEIEVNADATTALPSQYTVDASSLVVPAHSYNGYIKITGHFSTLEKGKSYYIGLNLLKVGDAVLNKQMVKTRVLMYRTCHLDLDKVGTSFEGTSYANSFEEEDKVTTFTPTVTRLGDTNEFSFDTLWGADFVGAYINNANAVGFLYAGKIRINDDLSIVIIPKDSWADGGIGFYDACSNTFRYTLTESLLPDDYELENVNVILDGPDN